MRRTRLGYDTLLKALQARNADIIERTVACAGGSVRLLYIAQLTDTNALAEMVIKPLMLYCASANVYPNAQTTVDRIIYVPNCRVDAEESYIESHILNGMAVILFGNNADYVVANLKKIEHRSIPTPDITYTIRGPKDCLVENIDVNLALVRYRLQDPNLKIDMFSVGRRTKTRVAVIYMQDIANELTVAEIEKRIGNVDTDSIWGTGELQAFLSNTKHDLFPQMGTTERSDWACEAVVEGRVLIFADGGQIALIAPHVFGDTMVACDDRYDNRFFGLFSRILRYIALFATLLLSAIYVALVSYHMDALPGSYVILLSQTRQNVLFSTLVEVLFIEVLIELIREAMIRVPVKIGTSISIVGAIIIGQAATTAGIFDPLLLIAVSASFMASFALPDYFSAHPIRILKFLVIVMTGLMGFYGFILALSFILTNLVSINSFGVPYLAPFAPFNPYDAKRAFSFSRSTSSKRMRYLRTKDGTRGK